MSQRGILLVNVGTPDGPSVPEVRRYLAEFLSDPHILAMPAPLRWLLLNAVILPFRPKKSAHAYQRIWTEHGSPLLVHSRAQAAAVQRALPHTMVRLGMRYGSPSIEDALREFDEAGVTKITFVPMFPQHAGATVESAVHRWEELLAARAQKLETHTFPPFHAMDGFVNAGGALIRETVASIDADHVLFSFHGIPVNHHDCLGEQCVATCYRGQCVTTMNLLAGAAGVTSCTLAFQSRLKGQRWIRPFTEDVLVELAQRGVKRLAVACPSFVADCLETIEEIGMRAAETFQAAGGEKLALVPSVNAHPEFITALARELQAAEPMRASSAATRASSA